MQALSNVRVVDLTHVIAGPFCAYQLGVMGAEIIKVESPDMPDMCRATTAEFPHGELGLNAFFTAQNANKRSLPINLKSEQGREVLHRLIRDADVLIENYRAGALAKIGLGYDDVKSIKPDLIYCSMTGFGQQGPKGQDTAYDNVIQAFSGLMAANGDELTSPVKIGPPILDYGTGIQAAFAIACALYQRTLTGQGQHIDVAMLDAALMLMSSNITYYHQHDKLLGLSGNDSNYNAGYCCYDASDGSKVMLGAFTAQQVADMWTVLGDKEYGNLFRGKQPPAMSATVNEDKQRIADIIRTKSAADWEKRFIENKVPAARVRQLDETLSEAQVKSRQVLQRPKHATQGDEQHYPTASFQYANNGPSLSTSPPMFAENSKAVLSELGYNETQIRKLVEDGVVAIL